MNGIVFFKTKILKELVEFYKADTDSEIWMEQADCVIFRHGNMLFGFCQRESVDLDTLITFFYHEKADVDRLYEKFKDTADSPPSYNEKYQIYQFFASDPEGRKLEFQWFENPVGSFLSGDQLLLQRRSIRKFTDDEVTDDLIEKVIDNTRFAPTARNTQCFYFKVIRDKPVIKKLSEVRGKSTLPIGNAGTVVAICADPAHSKRYVQDGCIAAYHFMLAAWYFGLGTCWIAAMDSDEVKDLLKVPKEHYIATVTPVGFPEKRYKEPPERKDISWFLREY